MSHGVVAHIFLPSDWPWNCLGKASISLVSNMWWRHSSGLKMGPFPRKNGLPDVCGGKRSIYFWICLGGTNDGTRIPNKKLRLVWAVIYVWNLTTALVCFFLVNQNFMNQTMGTHHTITFFLMWEEMPRRFWLVFLGKSSPEKGTHWFCQTQTAKQTSWLYNNGQWCWLMVINDWLVVWNHIQIRSGVLPLWRGNWTVNWGQITNSTPCWKVGQIARPCTSLLFVVSSVLNLPFFLLYHDIPP